MGLTGLREELDRLKEKYSADNQDIISALNHDNTIPLGIFSIGLGTMESLVIHMSETHSLREISSLLDRKYSTMANTLRKASYKPLQTEVRSDIRVPLKIFSDRASTPLRSLVRYLKEKHNLDYNEIARLLRKNSKSIGNAYRSARKTL